jgi:hypothetical protein
VPGTVAGMTQEPFAARLAQGDLGLFGHVRAQLGRRDRRSLLALEAALGRVSGGSFVHLEIGSYLGGSLQAVIADPACRVVVSIDPHIDSAPDDRGRPSRYSEVTTEAMRANLARVPGADLAKLVCLESSTLQLDPNAVERPDLCFVDGEHTAAAALRDARFCRRALRDDGCVVFHDAQIVYRGIKRFLDDLAAQETAFTAYTLPSALFVVELGKPRLRDEPEVRPLFEEGWRAYVFGLAAQERRRRLPSLRVVQLLRRARLSQD